LIRNKDSHNENDIENEYGLALIVVLNIRLILLKE
jgi:hypothetical protein